MMNLVRHALRENVDMMLAKSRRHCHAHGLHSIMVADCPGQIVRLFVTDADHTLWKNNPWERGAMSVGFHTHHCNITLVGQVGTVANLCVVEDGGGAIPLSQKLHAFRYRSALRGESPGFDSIQPSAPAPATVSEHLLRRNLGPHEMRAAVRHTVYVTRGRRVAWFVLEGKEDPNYEPITWSNADLTAVDMTGLYQPMDVERMKELLWFADSAEG